MKALQTRSPIHLYYKYTGLSKVQVSIYLEKDPTFFDTSTLEPRYNLQSDSINNESIFEISDLLRSANQYEYEKDFYEKRDTAIYVLCKAELKDSINDLIEVRHNFLRIRDGYVERIEQSQILNNTIPSDIREWNDNSSQTVITDNEPDVFGGNNAYLATDGSDDSLRAALKNNVNVEGVYTFSVWLKEVTNDKYIIELGGLSQRLSFDFSNEQVYFVGSFVLGFDVFKLSNWFKLSVTTTFDITDNVRIFSDNPSENEEVIIFNPTLTKGKQINFNATDLVLQDNLKSYYYDLDLNKVLVDKKFGDTYDLVKANSIFDIKDFFDNNAEAQSSIHDHRFDFEFTDKSGTLTTAVMQQIVLYECKYEPVKVTFLNRFGILQDLVFFKKRVDSSTTDSESYMADVITNGEVYTHLGQRRVYNKQAEAKVKLSSGFYPESFNTVFKQLIFSEMVFIDDEPAVISTSTFRQKTQIDDKLINYDIDFDFANDDINSIR